MQTINRFQREADDPSIGGYIDPYPMSSLHPKIKEEMAKYNVPDKTDVQIAAERYAEEECKDVKDTLLYEPSAIKHLCIEIFKDGWKACEQQIQNKWSDEELLEILKWGYLMGQKNTGIVDGKAWVATYKELKEKK